MDCIPVGPNRESAIRQFMRQRHQRRDMNFKDAWKRISHTLRSEEGTSLLRDHCCARNSQAVASDRMLFNARTTPWYPTFTWSLQTTPWYPTFGLLLPHRHSVAEVSALQRARRHPPPVYPLDACCSKTGNVGSAAFSCVAPLNETRLLLTSTNSPLCNEFKTWRALYEAA